MRPARRYRNPRPIVRAVTLRHPQNIRPACHDHRDSLTYDALGNVSSTITPLGYITRDFRDATGRDTLVTSPIDAGQQRLTSSRTVFDLADRPTLTQTFGPRVSYLKAGGVADSTAPETLTVATVYDSGGLVRRITRTASPDLANLHSLVTRMGYDPAGRKVVDSATDNAADTYAYDNDGHMVTHTTRDGGFVTWQYDALGELLTRDVSPFVTPIRSFADAFLRGRLTTSRPNTRTWRLSRTTRLAGC